MVSELKQLNVAIVGSGTMGTALSHVVASAGHRCTLLTDNHEVAESINKVHSHPSFFQGWALHSHVTASTVFENIIPSADLVVMAIPSYDMRTVARQLNPLTQAKQSVLSVTKGFEPLTHKLMSQVLQEEFSSDHIGTLSGPNITLDLVKNLPTVLIVSSRSQQVRQDGGLAFSSSTVKIVESEDILSYEYVSALKNIVALQVGLVTGLGLGDNFRALILAQGMAEINQLIEKIGLDSSTLYGLAGLSDIFLTCCSTFARNYTIGVDLGRGIALSVLMDELKTKGEVAEGIESVKAAYNLMQKTNHRLPLLLATYTALFQNNKQSINPNDFIEVALQPKSDFIPESLQYPKET